MPAWAWTALGILLNGAIGLVGALIPNRWLVGRTTSAFIAFAAGAMLAAVFVDVLPESVQAMGAAALPWTFGSVVAMTLLDWSFRRRAHGGPRALPAALLAGDALHNATDGAAIAAGFLASPRVGLVTVLAVIVHETPEEVGDYVILRTTGMARTSALLWLAAVQMTAAVGAAATFLAATAYARAEAIALAVAAGTFLYIACVDLIPDVLRRGREGGSRAMDLVGLVVGAGVVIAQSWIL